jgi:deazaflavin-dependent oxidoreductase (nitroreductase family)
MLVETVIHWLGGLQAYATLGVILYGLWKGTQRQPGHTTGLMGPWLRSPLFYMITSALFFGLCFLGWRPLPLLISPTSRAWMLAIGSLLYFPGMLLVLWARLTLGKNYFASTGLGVQLFAGHQLVTRGPFAFLRHPMYAGIILAALGSVLIYHTWTTLMFACFSPAMLNRARREEITLAAEFGEVWQAYCQRVPMWFPRLSRKVSHGGSPMAPVQFDWAKMKNVQKIHRALYAIGLGPIIGKIILLLTTTGRKSGLPRVTPLQYEEINRAYYLGAARGLKADWVRNIESNPNVEIRVGRKHLYGSAEIITDPAMIADFIEVRLERHPRIIGMIMEKAHQLPRRPSREQLLELAKTEALVIVHPRG